MAVDSVGSKPASSSQPASQPASSGDSSKPESSGSSSDSADKAKAEDSTYVVKRGDTLWDIAQEHDVELRELIEANPQIRNPDLIFAGQQVTIPGHAAREASHADRGRGTERPSIAIEHGALSAATILAQRSAARTNTPAPSATPAPPNGGAPLGDIVESVYESELGRPSDPGGKAHWVAYAQGLRDKGWSDEQIGNDLEARFHESEEYRAQHASEASPTAPVAPAAGAPSGQPPAVYDQYGNPRDMNWVAQTYGSDFERTTMTAPDGSVYRLAEIREREGPSNIDVYVRDAQGNPIAGVPVNCTNRYNNEQLPTAVTDTSGRAGFAMGPGSYIFEDTIGSGAFNIGVGNGDIPSDQGLRLGMLGNTNHRHLDLVFELVQEAPQATAAQPQAPAPAAPAPAAPASPPAS
ncbi:MAG: LysM peptidoglycan-binding domain-containing protein, partial [Deltaproteobacteria bacterium]|nr:LysM peptidoglycan-binding domain-containing protein [Deltaproteobacteria bacterium]